MSVPRRSVAALCATALTLAAALLVSAAPVAASGGTLTGTWLGVEIPVGDGSLNAMTITRNGQGTLIWRYHETNASSYCSLGGGGNLNSQGTAHVHGHTVNVTVKSAKCSNGLPGAFPTPFFISMTATGDGHINWDGLIFSRAGFGTVTPFTASEGPLPESNFFGHAQCTGGRIVNSGKVEDMEKCLITGDTSNLVPGTYQGHPFGMMPWYPHPTQWGSDYDGRTARLWRQTFVNNGDGTWTSTVLAYY
jgi:hypothetical protein